VIFRLGRLDARVRRTEMIGYVDKSVRTNIDTGRGETAGMNERREADPDLQELRQRQTMHLVIPQHCHPIAVPLPGRESAPIRVQKVYPTRRCPDAPNTWAVRR